MGKNEDDNIQPISESEVKGWLNNSKYLVLCKITEVPTIYDDTMSTHLGINEQASIIISEKLFNEYKDHKNVTQVEEKKFSDWIKE